MLYAKRMIQLPTSRAHQFVALSITAAVAFTMGVATGPVGRAALSTTAPVQTNRAAVVAPAPAITGALYDGGWAGGPPAGAILRSAPAVTELYDGGWAGGPPAGAMMANAPAVEVGAPAITGELYDGGWAGGPGPSARVSSELAAPEAGLASTERYDGGWAGGPGPQAAASATSALSRVPYDAGWALYDQGWAGGPKTASSNE